MDMFGNSSVLHELSGLTGLPNCILMELMFIMKQVKQWSFLWVIKKKLLNLFKMVYEHRKQLSLDVTKISVVQAKWTVVIDEY